ncbi:MAG: hypothetical protein H7232_00385 [Aeromicrobium sp.]|nr:hypothetical protein [Burkholderiales bacterium]
MFEKDYDEFAALLDDAYDLIGSGANKIIGPGAKSMFFVAMAKYPMSQVRAALSAHCLDRTRGRFTPKPADLIEQIEMAYENDGRPGPEEAWAIALTTVDEADTVVWTQEIAQAFGICRPVLESSGAISARKSFLEAYARLVTASRAACQPAQWSVSLGWDTARRSVVLAKAMTAGLLAAPTVAASLPAPDGEPRLSADARAQIASVRQMLKVSAEEKAEKADRELEAGWRDEVESKRQVAAMVAQYQALNQNTGGL